MTFPKVDQIYDNTPLSQRLAEQLRTMITEGALQPGTQLPNENELGERFNVSRATIRSALQTLEKVGFVIKKRGVGTFVSDEPLKVNNLSLNWGVTQVIRSTGATPGTLEMVIANVPADEPTSKRLHLDVGTPLLFIERVRTADERRVVFTQDYIPIDLVDGLNGDDSLQEVREYLEKHHSLYSFVMEYMSENVHHAFANISPLTADETVAKKLEIPVGSGILYLEQVDYNRDGNPLWLAREFHVANAFTFTVYRSM